MKNIENFIKYVKDNYLGDVFTNLSFKDVTTLKIGGQIECLYRPLSLDDLILGYQYICMHNIKYFVIGNGSNILASDKDYDGVVISVKELNKLIKISDNKFIAYSGIPSAKLAFELAKLGYTGSEFLSVIPGTIGGAIYMNSGAYGKEAKDIVEEVMFLNESGKIDIIKYDEIDFSYRKSVFQNMKGIIISALINVKYSNIQNLGFEKIATYKKNKKTTQPINLLSAGSTFKNPVKMPSWKIIDSLGYRGYIRNDVMVSNEHTNYLVNIKSATFDDMMYLINKIKKEAKETFGVDLECEWDIIE